MVVGVESTKAGKLGLLSSSQVLLALQRRLRLQSELITQPWRMVMVVLRFAREPKMSVAVRVMTTTPGTRGVIARKELVWLTTKLELGTTVWLLEAIKKLSGCVPPETVKGILTGVNVFPVALGSGKRETGGLMVIEKVLFTRTPKESVVVMRPVVVPRATPVSKLPTTVATEELAEVIMVL
jgi:hypothetical protein